MCGLLSRGGAPVFHGGGSFRCGARILEYVGSVVGACEPGCPVACRISLDQTLNPRPLHCKVDSYPQDHQGDLTI